MRRQPIRTYVAIVGLLAFLLIAFAAAPATASSQRFTATERYAHKLINCLRTGGKVTPAGICMGYGSGRYSRYRPPLKFSQKISNKVAWSYAKRVAAAGQCRHDLGGTSPDQRLRTIGLRDSTNGENLACMWKGGPRQMVVYWVRHWFKETSGGGWHWRQIKDPDFRVAGFGVARDPSGRLCLVVNFYGRRVA